MKTKLTLKEQSASVRFNRVDGVEFWLTPINRIFIKIGLKVVFPSLRGGSILTLDDRTVSISERVKEKLCAALRRQREIRQGWFMEEDENAFAYN